MSNVPNNFFSFSKLLVWDIDAAADFYKKVAGLEELARVEESIAGRKIVEIIFKSPYQGAGTFVLLKYVDAPKPGVDEAITGFTTDNVDAFVERAVAAGGALVQAAADMPAHGVRVAFVTDAEGHLLEVVQLLAQA